jgi:signal transduction histidine kinase
VANARRHADATHIWIALIYDEETLVLRIADDGRGFENAQARFVAEGHFGLQGMRERANAIRARLNFGAREDGGEASPGTVVMVELELKNPNRRSTG